MPKKFGIAGVMLAALFVMLILAACGNANENGSGAAQNQNADSHTETEPNAGIHHENQGGEDEALSGAVIVDGSGTVYPLMSRIAEEYMLKKQPDVSVQVGRAGTSAGFKKFIPGELDFADASRPIKKEELAELEAKGLKLGEGVLEFKLAYDGLTMVINKDNTWATEMTAEEAVNMFISGKYAADDKVKWSDIRPEWPAEEIKFYGPNENHGTYEFFFETVMDEQPMVTTAGLQQEYSTLVDLVSKDKNAVAFFGYGYYASNQDKLNAVKIDFGSGPVEPSAATIGEELPYAPFTRPVYTYLNAEYAKAKPQVLNFAYYVLEAAPHFAGETGFAPLPDEVYAEYKAQLDQLK
jgi:phosphate transport system substrate-binding protein